MTNQVFYHDTVNNCWMHRPKFKVILNPILRKLQFFTKKPWVIVSYVDMSNDIPVFKGYGLERVECTGKFMQSFCDLYIDGKKMPDQYPEGADIS